jgi:NAD(P)-dependent dehydrogenase (short-subunit alcohol dehydrogenase family)
MKPAKDPDVLTVDGDLADPATADRIISGELGHCGCIEALVNNADVYISKRAIHRAVIPAAPQNLQIWAVATTSESTDHMDTESAFGLSL